MGKPERLPKSVHEIAEVIGEVAALRLIGRLPRRKMRDRRYPGAMRQQASFYVPAILPADHWVIGVIGWHAAKRLSENFGGEIIKPAACEEIYRQWRNIEIIRMAGKGVPSEAIAEIVGISCRRVASVLSEAEKTVDREAENDEAECSSREGVIAFGKVLPKGWSMRGQRLRKI